LFPSLTKSIIYVLDFGDPSMGRPDTPGFQSIPDYRTGGYDI